jgi:hypothetical protein
MIKGFTYGVAPALVKGNPGMMSREIAGLALSRGLAHSDSKDPVTSLATSLAKEVREGRHKEIRAESVNGELRYYPKTGQQQKSPGGEEKKDPPHIEIRVSLSQETIDIVVLLAESREMGRSEVVEWLIEQGISHGEGMDRVVAGAREISQIKQKIATR